MHYKNGRAANEGDPVIAQDWSGKIRAGTLHSLNPGSTTCNGMVSYLIPGQTSMISVTIGAIYHADDAFAAIEREQPQKEAVPTPVPEAAPQAG